MKIVDNLNKIGSMKVIDAKFDKHLKILLVVVTLLGGAVTALGEIQKIKEAATLVPSIEKRLTVLETSVVIELKNINTRLDRIEKKIDGGQ